MTTVEIEPIKNVRNETVESYETKKDYGRVVVTKTIASYHECPHCKKGIKVKVVTALSVSESDFIK